MKTEKLCPICNSAVKGRSDKIFCSVKCKSIEQYEKRQENEQFFLKVEKQLRVNRKVLKRYNKSGFTTIRAAELAKEGFDPNFFTHYWKNQKGDVYLFVYEYGFLIRKEKDKEKYVLVIWQPYMKHKN
jgi:predicted nucleic acid-binding Zn ribbon protein